MDKVPAIVWILGFILVFLTFAPDYYHLSKVFRVLKVLTVISLLLPVLIVGLFISSDLSTMSGSGSEYAPDIFLAILFMSLACIGSSAFAWLVGYAYWLYAKKTNLFEISSPQLALMLTAAIAGWIATAYLVPLMLFGNRY